MIKPNDTIRWKAILCAALALLAMGATGRLFAQGAAATVSAQDFDARHTQDTAKNPTKVSCVLRLPEGKTQFHMGEVIPIEAVFSSRKSGQYRFNTNEGNRALPWASDTIIVDREQDTPDPLRAYYDPSKPGGYSGGGPRWQTMDTTTLSFGLVLNNWRRFDRPGVYRLYLQTKRMQRLTDSQVGIQSLGSLTTTSNVVQIEILPPDPVWSAQTLAKALPAFQSESSNGKPGADAARILRFLDTPESAQAMIDRYGVPTTSELQYTFWYDQARLGLLGSRRREEIIAQMQAEIQNPDFPIVSTFLLDMAQVQALAAYPDPAPPPPQGDPAAQEKWRKQSFMQFSAPNAWMNTDNESLQTALPHKRGAAHLQSAYTLFDMRVRNMVRGVDPATIAPILISEFGALTPHEQYALLTDYSWPYLRDPKMLAPLRTLYQNPQGRSDYEIRDHRTAALRRLSALSPKEGRRLLLAEIQSPHPQVNMDLLVGLPDPTLPKIEPTLAANLSAGGDLDTISVLIQRYGTRAILPQVKTFYSDKDDNLFCAPKAALLAYFLRVDPIFGAARVVKALVARKDTGCYRTLLSDITQYHRPGALFMPPQLQQIALTALNDPDADVASDAAQALGTHGSPPEAEAALWAQLRRLAALGQVSLDNSSRRKTAEALASSPAWLIDHKQLEEIRALFPDQKHERWFWVYTIDHDDQIFLAGDTVTDDGQNESWRIAQYTLTSRADLRRKLAQYPKGTAITLLDSGNPDNAKATQHAFTELRAFLAKRGVQLVRGK
ncbi:MAG: hypothetical protein ABIY70_25160 [Capsulimonas sp.]|uniref:hypothetical protein n=1 Tax=Capsulimonas sp. TaxID=2494211 RepID=UPI003267E845